MLHCNIFMCIATYLLNSLIFVTKYGMKRCALDSCRQEIRPGFGFGSCCCRSHQGKYAAIARSKKYGLFPRSPDETRAYHRAWATDKQKRIKQATPSWADKSKIKEFYLRASILTKETGITYEVDHIIPIKGKNVCGLHVETNLQVITQAENRKKGNQFTS